jgi:hypothetical protein
VIHKSARFIGILLLFLVFLQGAIIPHEWLHQVIESHQDTQDLANNNNADYKSHFSSAHTHCDYLLLAISTFHPAIHPIGKHYFFATDNFTYFSHTSIRVQSQLTVASRGPPTV